MAGRTCANKDYDKHLEWLRANKDKVKVHQKKSYLKNLDKRKVSGKLYYEANKERIIKRQRDYYENNTILVKSYQRNLRVLFPENSMFKKAKARAKELELDFNITKDDIFIPKNCPLLEIPLSIGDGFLHDNSPTLDRIDNSQGYIKGNIMVISYKANRMKSNSTFKEFETMYLNWKKETL